MTRTPAIEGAPADALVQMNQQIAHRGPDGSGYWNDAFVQLAHRRLSIVDLVTGAQPFVVDEGKLVLVFNGEIYNHPELRPTLERKGHCYRTTSDTETIAHAYLEFDIECASHLEGMFAFVLYDQEKKLLFGARDRMGKKPLYLFRSEEDRSEVSFAFASEIKALRSHPEIERQLRLRQASLLGYLSHDYVAGGSRIFEPIEQLAPGEAFTLHLADPRSPQFRRWSYWHHDPIARMPVPTRTSAKDQVAKLLEKSIDRRLMADVPVGLFLSGGIDSSAIAALWRRLYPKTEIPSFCIGFDEPSFDESASARRLAEELHLVHHEKRFTLDELRGELPRVISAMDEPFADPSILPVSLLSRFAKEHVKVVLGGDGGDEVFAGYDPFRAIFPALQYRKWVPNWGHDYLARPIVHRLGGSDANLALSFKLKRFLRGTEADVRDQLPTWMGAFSLDQLQKLLPSWREHLEPAKLYAESRCEYERLQKLGADPIELACGFFERFYLPDDILTKVDRASMMHGLEVRCPFLDRELVEYVHGLPSSWKFAKKILKQSVRGILPSWVLERKKKGFGVPIARWIRKEMRLDFEQTLLEEFPTNMLPIELSFVRELLVEHSAGRANNYKELWALFVFAKWSKHHLTS